LSKVKLINFHGREVLQCADLSIGPYFSSTLSYRINHRLACNIVITGEPGIGKTYMACDIARMQEGVTGGAKDRFKIEQVVFRFSDYMNVILQLKMGKGIVFDEPSYSMGKRDWFKEVNKVLVQTIESQRFLVHPVYIPIINQALLDKTIRSYLIQYRIHVIGRGHALVYRLQASQHQEKVYHTQVCELIYRMFDREKCQLDSCLGCDKLIKPGQECQIFRAQYERKKASIQMNRYEEAKETASKKESQEITNDQLVRILMEDIEALRGRTGNIDMFRIMQVLRERKKITISQYKAYQLKKILEIEKLEKGQK
jgi:hypothetical protein